MAGKFPITTARQELGFTPTTAVRADIDVRQGPSVGAALGQALIAGAGALQERSARKEAIRIKNRANLDVLSAKQATNRRQLIADEIATMKTNTSPENWEEETIKIVTQGNSDISAFDYSPEEAAKQQIISQGDLDSLPEQSFADASRTISKAAIKTVEENLTSLHREGDPEKIAAGVIDSVETLKDNGVSAKAILLKLKAAKEAGEKLRKQDVLDGWQSAIAVEPDTTGELLEAELEARKTGKGIIPELTGEDIQSLLNSVTNRKTQLTADAQAALNAKNKALETQLHNDIVAGTASITDIAKSGLPAEAQRRLERDLSDVPERDLARTWAIQDSSEATDEANRILATLEGGQLDINEARSAVSLLARIQTIDGRSILTKSTFDSTMDKITKGGRDAIDLFTAEQTTVVKNVLVARLNERQARLAVREQAGTLTPTQRRQFSTTEFLLQVEKNQLILYENTLAQRLRTLGIEDTSGKEAKAEAVKIWEIIKRKSLEQRINDFQAVSGRELVRPENLPRDLWDDKDMKTRIVIINAISEGFSNTEIREALIR